MTPSLSGTHTLLCAGSQNWLQQFFPKKSFFLPANERTVLAAGQMAALRAGKEFFHKAWIVEAQEVTAVQGPLWISPVQRARSADIARAWRRTMLASRALPILLLALLLSTILFHAQAPIATYPVLALAASALIWGLTRKAGRVQHAEHTVFTTGMWGATCLPQRTTAPAQAHPIQDLQDALRALRCDHLWRAFTPKDMPSITLAVEEDGAVSCTVDHPREARSHHEHLARAQLAHNATTALEPLHAPFRALHAQFVPHTLNRLALHLFSSPNLCALVFRPNAATGGDGRTGTVSCAIPGVPFSLQALKQGRMHRLPILAPQHAPLKSAILHLLAHSHSMGQGYTWTVNMQTKTSGSRMLTITCHRPEIAVALAFLMTADRQEWQGNVRLMRISAPHAPELCIRSVQKQAQALIAAIPTPPYEAHA